LNREEEKRCKKKGEKHYTSTTTKNTRETD